VVASSPEAGVREEPQNLGGSRPGPGAYRQCPTLPPRVKGTEKVEPRPTQAAQALGISPDYFDTHVRHELKLIRKGRLVLVPLRELERWAQATAARTLAA
jgi:hypothetical protein